MEIRIRNVETHTTKTMCCSLRSCSQFRRKQILQSNPMFHCRQHCNIVTQYCNNNRLIALANCNQPEQIAILHTVAIIGHVDNLSRGCAQMSDAKHLIRLFCTSSQSGFIYKLASKSYYELLNFAVDGLIYCYCT